MRFGEISTLAMGVLIPPDGTCMLLIMWNLTQTSTFCRYFQFLQLFCSLFENPKDVLSRGVIILSYDETSATSEVRVRRELRSRNVMGEGCSAGGRFDLRGAFCQSTGRTA